MTPDRRDEIIRAMYAEGYSEKEIGFAVGQHRSTIHHRFKRLGLAARSHRRNQNMPVPRGSDYMPKAPEISAELIAPTMGIEARCWRVRLSDNNRQVPISLARVKFVEGA